MRRVIAFALTCLLFPIASYALNVPSLPPGMCALSKSVPEQAVIIDYLQSANTGSNEVLSSFASCQELAAIAQKKATAVTHYGAILKPILGQNLGLDRKTYVTTVASAYNSGLLEAGLAGARDAAPHSSGQAGLAAPTDIDVSTNRIVFQNDQMVIIGLHQTNSFTGTTTHIASTAAMTLLGRAPIAVTLYAPYSPTAFQQASTVLQPFVASLIAANP